MQAELIAVYTTVADPAVARELARAAVDARLAACVQIEPVQSIYRWDGAVQSEPEQRVMFKTTLAMYAELQQFILARHPYELPAVFAVPASLASPAYAGWVAQSVRVGGVTPETP